MIIIIDDFGVTIEKNNFCFELSSEKGVRIINPHKITAMHILKPCTITSPAILLAAEFEIPVLFFSEAGKIKAKLYSPGFGSIATIRYNQVFFTNSAESTQWIKKCLIFKIEEQLSLLAWCKNRTPSCAEKIDACLSDLNNSCKKLQTNTDIENIRITEAVAGKYYWDIPSQIMQPYMPFQKRSQHPGTDNFNALINYAYGMLYSVVESATVTAGLDPAIGIMHAEEYNKPVFVYDAIEPFRPWTDKVVIELCMQKIFTAQHFEKKENGIWLSKSGKQILIPAINNMLFEATLFNKKRIKRKDQIQYFLTTLAQYLLKEFKPQLHA